jgi:hypothetical protein
MLFCPVDRGERQLIRDRLEPPQLTFPLAASLWHWTAPSLGSARGADRDQPHATASHANRARLRDNQRRIEAMSSVPGPGAYQRRRGTYV